ncbi:MAG: hypothetical protein EBR02_05515, partial [Alphaproteobacteria bacterium]|nr:hypothetical protein [Alphaproteobacteria bacterium]
EKEVWIVDFKSNRRPPKNAIPAAYIHQMQLYQRVLAAIYPQKPVRCALLWTATAQMTVLDEALLATYI